MSLLPGQIISPDVPLGRADQTGLVFIEHDWFLLVYNLCLQVLGNGSGLPADALIDLSSADTDAIDSDAVSLRLPISNNSVQVSADLTPTSYDLPDIARALLLAQDPPLQDVPALAQPSAAIAPTGSPFSYTAPFNGSVIVTSGTVSHIAIKRQGVTIDTGLTVGPFALSQADQLIVTYSGAPTMTFLPT